MSKRENPKWWQMLKYMESLNLYELLTEARKYFLYEWMVKFFTGVLAMEGISVH